jgi:hypothetical protein
MIVNPQLFNYRLITGSLVVAIAVLSVVSFTNQQSIQAHQQFLEQEKKLVEIELSQMIKQYDEVSVTSNLISSQLEQAKNDAKITLDSLRLLKSDLSVISKVRRHVSTLQSKNSILFKTIDSLNLVTNNLYNKNLLVSNELQEQRLANNSLLEKNKKLSNTLEKASVLTANSFHATAYNNLFGKTLVTSKASNAERIEVCFTIAENVLALKGEKDIYIQIVNPKNNVFADKGAINFGESSLIYSLKKMITYENQVIDVCLNIDAEKDDQPLIAGTYFITVFNKDRKLGSTQLHLN